jgi:hypothetical protein
VIYVKGTGGMSWFNDTMNGTGNVDCRTAACGNWILIRTWPAGTPGCSVECTATITGNSNINSPTNIHHIMFDGGPDLKIRFNSNGASATYANNVLANYITIYRTQLFCTGANTQLGWAVGGFAVSDHVSFINNEFYGCNATGDQISAVYVGPGSGGGYSNFLFQNNIVRDFVGEGLEINPRVTSSNATIIGNAIHNVGKGTCPTGWNCRPAITLSIQSGGGNNNTVIANNLMWDLGSSCVWARGGGSPAAAIYNNVCYDYGKGSGGGGPVPEGISGFSNDSTATVRNNIIFAPNGTNPFDGSPFAASNNLCGPGKSCGSAGQVWSASTVLTTDPTSITFMQPSATSSAIGAGLSIPSVTIDYAGKARPPYDIGAFVGGSLPLQPTTNLRVIR